MAGGYSYIVGVVEDDSRCLAAVTASALPPKAVERGHLRVASFNVRSSTATLLLNATPAPSRSSVFPRVPPVPASG